MASMSLQRAGYGAPFLSHDVRVIPPQTPDRMTRHAKRREG